LAINESSKQDAKNNLKLVRVRGLINPFDKSRYHIKVTSNRRRWSHTFPESNQLSINYQIYEINKYYFYYLEIKNTKKFYDDFEFSGLTELGLCEMENILENIQILKKKCLFLVTVVNYSLNVINCFFSFYSKFKHNKITKI